MVEIELQSMQPQQVLSPPPTLVQTARTTLEYRITRTFVMEQNLESINSLLERLMEDLGLFFSSRDCDVRDPKLVFHAYPVFSISSVFLLCDDALR